MIGWLLFSIAIQTMCNSSWTDKNSWRGSSYSMSLILSLFCFFDGFLRILTLMSTGYYWPAYWIYAQSWWISWGYISSVISVNNCTTKHYLSLLLNDINSKVWHNLRLVTDNMMWYYLVQVLSCLPLHYSSGSVTRFFFYLADCSHNFYSFMGVLFSSDI